MKIAVNIKDNTGREYGVHVLYKFNEGYFWALVRFNKNPNLNTIVKHQNSERWIKKNNDVYATFPFSEDDISAD